MGKSSVQIRMAEVSNCRKVALHGCIAQSDRTHAILSKNGRLAPPLVLRDSCERAGPCSDLVTYCIWTVRVICSGSAEWKGKEGLDRFRNVKQCQISVLSTRFMCCRPGALVPCCRGGFDRRAVIR